MTRCLLIDADILAYRASAATERRYDWGDGVLSVSADLEAAKQYARGELDRLMAALDGDRFVICLSDDWNNFRSKIDPTYKTNRTGTRPEELYTMKEWLAETYITRRVEWLEADDVMGIMATTPSKEDRIMVSMDKDMKTVPGLLYRPQEANKGVQETTLAQADEYHLYQTLIGDTTDGYPGCPGVGPGSASAILAGVGWEAYEHTFKAGPRKGLTETRWRPKEYGSPWPAIVSAYFRAGKWHEDAVKQARLAFILRKSHWQDGKPVMWEPPQLEVV